MKPTVVILRGVLADEVDCLTTAMSGTPSGDPAHARGHALLKALRATKTRTVFKSADPFTIESMRTMLADFAGGAGSDSMDTPQAQAAIVRSARRALKALEGT